MHVAFSKYNCMSSLKQSSLNQTMKCLKIKHLKHQIVLKSSASEIVLISTIFYNI